MKKMKRLLMLTLFFIPIMVFAQSKYEVSEINLIEKEGEATENEKASFSNGKLHINIKLNNPGEYLKYEIKIRNTSNSQYIMNVNTSDLSDEYIKYIVEYENNSPIINPNETKTIYLLIKMEKDVPMQLLMDNNGVYNDKKTINFSLNNDDVIAQNPETKNDIIIIFLLIIITVILFTLIMKSKKVRFLLSVLLIIYLLIPPQIIAIEKVDFVIESEVEINKQDTYTIKEYNYDTADYDYNNYSFIKGMRGIDYINLNSDQHLGGFYISPTKIGCDRYEYYDYEFEKCLEETSDYMTCTERMPNVNNNDFYLSSIQNSQSGYYVFVSCCLSGETIVETKNKKTKKRKRKKLKDLTYDDLVLVWDFDNGCLEWAEPLWIQEPEEVPFYYELTFDDGTVLEVIGDHKIYNADIDKFVNCIENNEFEVGSHTINDKDEVLTLISKERVDKINYAYNVITMNHINIFANSVLTSWKINNLYDIESRQFKKDNTIKVELDKDKIPENYYQYLRLSEIPYDLCENMKDTQEYIYDLVNKLEKKKKKK